VIGGLLFATTATLFVVPILFTLVHGSEAAETLPASAHPAE